MRYRMKYSKITKAQKEKILKLKNQGLTQLVVSKKIGIKLSSVKTNWNITSPKEHMFKEFIDKASQEITHQTKDEFYQKKICKSEIKKIIRKKTLNIKSNKDYCCYIPDDRRNTTIRKICQQINRRVLEQLKDYGVDVDQKENPEVIIDKEKSSKVPQQQLIRRNYNEQIEQNEQRLDIFDYEDKDISEEVQPDDQEKKKWQSRPGEFTMNGQKKKALNSAFLTQSGDVEGKIQFDDNNLNSDFQNLRLQSTQKDVTEFEVPNSQRDIFVFIFQSKVWLPQSDIQASHNLNSEQCPYGIINFYNQQQFHGQALRPVVNFNNISMYSCWGQQSENSCGALQGELFLDKIDEEQYEEDFGRNEDEFESNNLLWQIKKQ